MTSVIYLIDTRYGQRGWLHPSARHRCYHYADVLDATDHQSLVIPLERVSAKLLGKFEHAIFHRPTNSKRFLRAFKLCRQNNVTMHADYDDLVFSADYAEQSPLYLNGGRRLQRVEAQFQANGQAAGMFDSFLTSTRFLQQKINQHFSAANVTVLPNALPRLFKRPIGQSTVGSTKVIGYFPGSRGHEADFNSIYSALKDLLGKRLRLLIVGRWNHSNTEALPGVVHLPFSDYNQYLKLLSQVDISVAPLQNNVFNNSKSAVKLIESVSVGTPIVATAIPDMQDHHNALAVLVKSNNDWKASIVDALHTAEDRGMIQQESRLLANRYSVSNRLRVLQEHLGCAA